MGILGGMPTLRPGPFVDPSLQVGDFALADGLPGFIEAAGLRWDPHLVARLVGVATEAQALLDTVGRACLVHSDLNPKNLLVDPETLEVTAVLDWEFAHSGHPFTDLGNALRFDRAPAYVEAVLAGYRERHAVPAGEALALARAADLWALVDLASRAGHEPGGGPGRPPPPIGGRAGRRARRPRWLDARRTARVDSTGAWSLPASRTERTPARYLLTA